jgi:hypothetical protein
MIEKKMMETRDLYLGLYFTGVSYKHDELLDNDNIPFDIFLDRRKHASRIFRRFLTFELLNSLDDSTHHIYANGLRF